MREKPPVILWFSDVDKTDIEIIGDKGLRTSELAHAGFPIPKGFIVTTEAYRQFIEANKLIKKIYELIATIHFDHPDSIMQVSSQIKKILMHAPIPDLLTYSIHSAYTKLGGTFHHAPVAIKPSFIPEKSQLLSLIPSQPATLNIQGEANVLLTIKEIWASLFAPRPLVYRHEHHSDHLAATTGIIVQKMIASEQSGIMYTQNPLTGDKKHLIIEAILGHEALLAHKQETPDTYEVQKFDLSITKKLVGRQEKFLEKVGTTTKQKAIPENKQEQQKITDNQILDLALLGKKIERHQYFAQEIEWASEKNHLYIVQSRELIPPTQTQKVVDRARDIILTGIPASPGLVSGVVKLVENVKSLGTITKDDILVVKQTIPEVLPAMRKAAAIITDKGGKLSHAVITSKRLAIPAIVGAEHATKLLRSGLIITVNGTNGEIYRGGHLKTLSHRNDPSMTATKVYVHVEQKPQDLDGEPDGILTTNPSTKDSEMLAKRYPTVPLVYTLEEKKFAEKLAALKTLREQRIFTKLCILLPMKATISEFKELKQQVTKVGLHRSPTVDLWMNLATPAHIIELASYKEIGIDGIVIDPVALATHIMGSDKDADLNNPAVLGMLEQTLTTAQKHHLITAIVNHNFAPHFLEKLIRWGITIIITKPEKLKIMRKNIGTIEQKIHLPVS